MNRNLVSLLLWASWFLASAVLGSLLRTSAELLATRALTAHMAQDFASASIGIIALIVTQEITDAYRDQAAS